MDETEGRGSSSSQPRPLHGEKFGRLRAIRAQLFPRCTKLPHAVRTILAAALRLNFSHRDRAAMAHAQPLNWTPIEPISTSSPLSLATTR